MSRRIYDLHLPQLPEPGFLLEITMNNNKPAKQDNGSHYRYTYRVPVSSFNAECGELTIRLDPFRIASIYGITSFPQLTVLKKILCTGNRGAKSLRTDIDDCICALERWKELLDEDALLDKVKSLSKQAAGGMPPIDQSLIQWLDGKETFNGE